MNLFFRMICYSYWHTLRMNGLGKRSVIEDRFLLWQGKAALHFSAGLVYTPVLFLCNKYIFQYSIRELIGIILAVVITMGIIINTVVKVYYPIYENEFLQLSEIQRKKEDMIDWTLLLIIMGWFVLGVALL